MAERVGGGLSLLERLRDVFITAGVRRYRGQTSLHTLTCKRFEKSVDELSQWCDFRLLR